ncbi:DNA repair protein RAD50 isoform X2 [Myripristis murdjan]|uniref:DNA repair protein RAD50 isoform X2 n=1 Tax=Myripristis murdjan TaxID=586833 RepID=UPI001175F3BD|nr:DNA repair protein RAD50-like isoform X2 [Myripristis murdjan]
MYVILRANRGGVNFIPTGRQLTRTPPLNQVKRQLDFCSDDVADGDVPPHVGSQCTKDPKQEMEIKMEMEMEMETDAKAQNQSFSNLNRTFDFNSPKTPKHNRDALSSDFTGSLEQPTSSLNRTFDMNNSQTNKTSKRSRTQSTICSASLPEAADANSMLRGMEGYELTADDLEFIEKMQQEKRIKKLQGELVEVERQLESETMALELALAAKEQTQAELRKFPSCEELIDLAKVFLKTTSPLTEGMDMESKSLVARVKEKDIQRVTEEETTQMETTLADKRQTEMEETGQQEKQILSKLRKIQGLMGQLSDLKSELAKAEKQVEVEDLNIKEEPQAIESNVDSPKPQRRKRKKDDKTAETLHDTTNQSKPTKRNTRARKADKKTDNQASLKDDTGNKNTHEPLKTSTRQTKQKSKDAKQKLTKTVKAAKMPQRKVTEQESHPPESSQAVSTRITSEASKTTASQGKTQGKVDSGKAQSTSEQPPARRTRKKATVVTLSAAEADQNPGLRRSKRIASKKLNLVGC